MISEKLKTYNPNELLKTYEKFQILFITPISFGEILLFIIGKPQIEGRSNKSPWVELKRAEFIA